MIQHNGKKLCSSCFAELKEKETVCPVCGYSDDEDSRYPIALPIGTILLGKYVIGKLLGKGGFGITYLAFDMKEGKTAAIKEYLPDSLIHRNTGDTLVSTYLGDKEEAFKTGAEKFYEEAKTIARFNSHPNIIHVSEFFYENNTAYFVMEYIKGVDLKTYVAQKGGKLSEQETLNILLPLLDALESVHGVGVLHRDISPDNIFVTSDGVIKLLDFGSARQVLGEQSKSLSVILKPGFAPIEQYQTRGKQGEWTDIYALAATTYYCLTGKVPEASMDRVEKDNLAKPSKLGADVSAKLEAVLIKALSVRAVSRYQTVKELKKAVAPLIPSPKAEKAEKSKQKDKSASSDPIEKKRIHLLTKEQLKPIYEKLQKILKNKKAVTAMIAVCAVLVALAGIETWNAVGRKHLATGGGTAGTVINSSSGGSASGNTTRSDAEVTTDAFAQNNTDASSTAGTDAAGQITDNTDANAATSPNAGSSQNAVSPGNTSSTGNANGNTDIPATSALVVTPGNTTTAAQTPTTKSTTKTQATTATTVDNRQLIVDGPVSSDSSYGNRVITIHLKNCSNPSLQVVISGIPGVLTTGTNGTTIRFGRGTSTLTVTDVAMLYYNDGASGYSFKITGYDGSTVISSKTISG